MPNLPDPAILTADGVYDFNLSPGREYLITLSGTFGGATVALTTFSDALGAFVPVEDGSWTADSEEYFTTLSNKARLTVTDAGSTSIGITIIKQAYSRNGGGSFSTLSMAEYNALTTEEQNNGTIYYIHD